MKLLFRVWIFACLVAGVVGLSFADPPDPRSFNDQSSLNQINRSLNPVRRVDRAQDIEAYLVWDNGGFVTHPGAGVGGSDVSMASEELNSAGNNVRQWEDNEYFRIADKFMISELTGIVQVSTFGYEPFEAQPAWLSANLKIWQGQPGHAQSEIVFERDYDALDLVFAEAYRILHLEELTDVRRPIFEIRWGVTQAAGNAPLWLEPGEYWIDWQVTGGETGWAIYVMEANPDEPDYPATVSGVAQQFRPIGWGPMKVATPFLVFGISDDVFLDRFQGAE